MSVSVTHMFVTGIQLVKHYYGTVPAKKEGLNGWILTILQTDVQLCQPTFTNNKNNNSTILVCTALVKPSLFMQGC